MLKRIDVRAFVDWNSQIGNAGQTSEARPSRRALATAHYVTEQIAATLPTIGQADYYSVEMRLYYGWYQGLTPTEMRKALAALQEDRLLPTTKDRTSFDWRDMFGDKSLDAYDNRLHPRLGIHFPNTLRVDRDSGERTREKLVDTCMSCDILYSARSEPDGWRLVVAEDDDVVPSVFMAERWSKERGGKNIILRNRTDFAHLQMNGLLALLNRAC